MKKLIVFIFLFLFLTKNQNTFSQTSDVEKHPILTSKFQLGAGLYIPTRTVKLGIDGESENQEIEFDEALKFNKNEATPQFNFDWRFAKKWKVSLEYFDFKNSSKAVLQEDIEWEDYVLKEGSSVTGGINLALYRAYIGRVLSQGQKHEFGVGLGIHGLNLNPFIKGTIYLNDEVQEFDRLSVSSFAPLPNLALWYFYAPTPKWAFTARLDWFGLKVDNFSGALWDFGPSVRYQIIKNLGVSLDYRYFKVAANVDKTNWEGDFYMIFHGPTFTLIGNL